MAVRTLTEIARLAQEIYKSLPGGTEASNKAFRIWKLATDSDARETRDEPTVRAAKKAARKSTK